MDGIDDMVTEHMAYGWPEWALMGLALMGLIMVVRAIVKGGLVARSVMDARIRDKDDQIAWLRGSNESKDRTIHTLTEQNETLMETAKATRAVVEALPKAISGGDR